MTLPAERAEILAELVQAELAGTEEGHCARVDFLDRDESHAICQVLRASPAGASGALAVFVLRGGPAPEGTDLSEILISTDQAIERRNRKQERLCLFVPADIVDAAASSLGN